MLQPFTLRDAREEDMPYVQSYAAVEGMDALPGPDDVTVAVNGDDVPVGFIRIASKPGGVCHINPVVTCETWRGYGVGRALVEDALARCGELRLVARGASVAFYRTLGFVETDWELIDRDLTDDCDGCPMLEECAPMPMRKVPACASEETKERL